MSDGKSGSAGKDRSGVTELDGRLGAIQHAINNPLTVVIANIDYALECGEPGTELHESLQQARAAAEQIKAEVRALGLLQPASSPPPAFTAAAPRGRRPRVLLIDDNELVLRSLRRGLRSCEVVCCEGGLEAMSLLNSLPRADDFDVIFCDVSMPGMSGTDFLRALRIAKPDDATKVVFVTGGATSLASLEDVQMAGVPTITKPVDLSKMKQLIALHARRR